MAPRFVPNDAAIDALLHSPTGPVYRHVNAFARQVEAQAKRTAPVDTGALRASTLASPINVGPSSLTLRIGSDLFYAYIVHQGRKAIVPVRAPALRFYWKQRGHWVRTLYVNPAVGRPYIWDAAVLVNGRQPAGLEFDLRRGPLPR